MVNRVFVCALCAASAALPGCGGEVRQTEGGVGESSLLDTLYGDGYVDPAEVPDRVSCEDWCAWRHERHGCDVAVCEPFCESEYLSEMAEFGCELDVVERWHACLIRYDAQCGAGCPEPVGEQMGECASLRAADTCDTLPGFQDFGEPCPPE